MASRSLLPLSGVAGVALIFGSFFAAGSAPDAGAPVRDVTAFYAQHDEGQMTSGALLGLGALLFLIFAAALTGLLRGAGATDASSALCLAGGAVATVGMVIFAGLTFALGEVSDDIDPAALQALHVLNQEMFFPLTVGTAAFLLGAGTAVARTRAVAPWLGWIAIVLGIVAAVPSHVLGGALDHIGFIGFIGLGVWMLLVGVLLALRPASAEQT